ncbi:C6 zinc finger domain protein [Penicillium longicatenatum]|uniref:C6 zinc finger domain protein n=1 Tax=Penicillium longicatenatum TaxID=1561947 RepID=UPI00254685BD|nr:C6 zinc finger domain protein [Penicillium longicatenatum]KAJ5650781.1 C6 zinc finger domain protein [Penicillium longicatenatum]
MSNPRSLKRQRIYRACDQCRRRKSKCDGEQPVCSICSQANRGCTYEAGGGRRGLPSGYVRSLEIFLGFMLKNVPNSESPMHNLLRDSRGNGNFLTSKLGNQSASFWRKSKLHRDISQLLTSGSEDSAFDDQEWEPVEPRDQEGPLDDLDTTLSNPEHNIPETIQELPNPIKQPQDFTEAQIPENTSDLVDFYFTYTHCWFPILERRSVLRAMHQSNGHPSQDSSSHMVLWSLITYASAMKGIPNTGALHLFSLQLTIEQQTLARWDSLDVGHIQAMLIIALIHIAMANISQAWTLVGQASRMLATLPLSTGKARLNHTINGCVLLDNILSALLGRAPCFSQEEQSACVPVEEDDLEEWDVWSPSRPSADASGRRIPSSPLRALSTFNLVQQLMQNLCQILYQPLDVSRVGDLLHDLRQKQSIISRSHSYDRRIHASPPLLILHLTSAFTTLSLCRRFEPVSPRITDLCVSTINFILDTLDHYRETTGAVGSSPLTLCFALQCQKCLDFSNFPGKEAMRTRISRFLCPLKADPYEWNNHLEHLNPMPSSGQGTRPPGVLNGPVPVPSIEDIHTSTRSTTFQPQQTSSVLGLPSLSASAEFPTSHSLARPGDAEIYDALFEEMVISFPTSRQEPSFAQNLGFYDGDLDTDFLAQLQQLPAD